MGATTRQVFGDNPRYIVPMDPGTVRTNYAGFSHSEVGSREQWVRQLNMVPTKHDLPMPPSWWLMRYFEASLRLGLWKPDWEAMDLGDRIVIWLMAPDADWIEWGYLKP